MIKLFILISIVFFSCTEDPVGPDSPTWPATLYVCDQMADKVVVLDASTDDLEEIRVIDIDFDESAPTERPHFIAIDEVNGYWFVSTFMSGYVGMYSLETDSLLGAVEIGDSPALLAADTDTQTLYVSKMMAMMGMPGGEEYEISVVDYSSGLPELATAINIPALDNNITEFPQPHALSIANNVPGRGTLIATASNSADWISMIFNDNTNVVSEALVEDDPRPEDGYGLQPIQSTQKDNLIFYSLSGTAQDSIPGEVRSWSTFPFKEVDRFTDFTTADASPWHIIASPTAQEVFVALRGTSNGNGGVACLTYDDDGNLTWKWEESGDAFMMMHGIAVSGDGTRVYSSSSADGKIHIFDTSDGSLIGSRPAAEMQATGIAITLEQAISQ